MSLKPELLSAQRQQTLSALDDQELAASSIRSDEDDPRRHLSKCNDHRNNCVHKASVHRIPWRANDSLIKIMTIHVI